MSLNPSTFNDVSPLSRTGRDRLNEMAGEIGKMRGAIPGGFVGVQGPGATPMPQRLALDARWCEVIAIAGDYLVCRPLSFDADGNELLSTDNSLDFDVAKPHDLRVTPWHNKSIVIADEEYTYSVDGTGTQRTSTRTSDDDVETQVVVPPYVQRTVTGGSTYRGSVILAGIGIAMGTHVTRPVADETRRVIFQDMNVAGRAWAVKYEE